MGKKLFIALGLLAAPLHAFSQSAVSPMPLKAEAPETAETVAPSSYVVIIRDTPLELIATKEISTANIAVGAQFALSLNKALVVDGRTIAPWGTRAYGEVTSAAPSGNLGVTGKMSARLLYLQLGEMQIKLQGDVTAHGQGGGSAGIAFLLGGPVGLFHRGNNAKIKAGEIVTGFVDEDVTLDVSGSTIRRVELTKPAPAVDTAKASGTH